MPYTGKPSHGCETCKKRHIKCDESRPACGQCTTSKRQCPGYKDKLETVLRNQNDSVRQAVQRRERKAIAKRNQEAVLEHLGPSMGTCNRDLNLIEPLPYRASCFFFQTYLVDLVSMDAAACRGFLEFLVPIYSKSKSDSALSLSVLAVSLCLYGVWMAPTKEAESFEANATFSRALRATQEAILDPVESRADETLMAVLMLGLYEALTKTFRSQRPSGQHGNGAVALIQHRGLKNFETEAGKKMLLSVRSMMVRLEIFYSVKKGESAPELWEEPMPLPHNPATLLDRLCHDAFSMSNEDADVHLASWLNYIPETWHPVHVDTDIESYNGCDIYPDIRIMMLFNQWRCARINVGASVQELVDGVCASVPFALGNRDKPSPLYQPGFEYPHLPGKPTTEQHYRAASGLGGWYLLMPLTRIARLQYPLRPGQREWILQQIGRITKIHDIRVENEQKRSPSPPEMYLPWAR